jgi:hypothetical protein
MRAISKNGQSPLGPQLCPRPIQLEKSDDDGISVFRGMLIAGTASIVLWGIFIALVMMLRSKS